MRINILHLASPVPTTASQTRKKRAASISANGTLAVTREVCKPTGINLKELRNQLVRDEHA
jgi:hypothetical protein